ncbi:Predicted house-cleaning NTP pyrophosphatase, Maf/HAM1 superfamily [Muriicola jejuensis]|uniref:RagB/SusD family nutrient uptake outer membrane protein n=1 Tax=Muriicola jejuensis TaxID=504488 RepID=A0A6P0UL13_9FLAO|nr:RagB/SusD family nutrient uptake outer membrane protein [Muriicola jejuensis]NER11743.1 RagB/SusD family nutrient uptake outer membrane protein [Muriicola jejuensis]SMP24816.1 Predicted house-cleaning NTP pyrophosphatase, Maf/HAM1 superfamily [Muriicola jejuensis]
MKNYRKIFYLFGLVTMLVACNDAIDIDQPGRLDADAAFESVADLQSGLFGVYANYDLSGEIAFSSIFTDELSIGFDNGGQGLADYGFVLNAGSVAPAVFWTGGYAAINSANRLIEAAESITPEAGEEAQYNDILGQSYFLRAWAHWFLMEYFTTDYADDNALGVIALDRVPSIDEQLLRNTNGEVYALILADLDRAESLISTDTSDPTFANRDAVTALRARIAAYRENYTLAATLSQQLLDKYGLANRAQYEAMFLDTDNTEVIFKLERTNNDPYDGQGATGSPAAGGWAGARFAFVDATLAGSPYFEMGRSLFNLYDPADIRYDVNVAPTSLIDPDYTTNNDPATDILVIQKYPGSEGQPLMNDLKVFRSSEMLLIRAEAYADAGSINGATNSAAALLKQLNDARFGTDTALPVFANQTEAFAAILDARRIELSFEGHRYKDLKRLGERANQGVLKDPIDCAFNGACSLPATDFRFTLPLPIVEFNANPGLREQQNPGY